MSLNYIENEKSLSGGPYLLVFISFLLLFIVYIIAHVLSILFSLNFNLISLLFANM